jgi:hypothetical protein
MAPIPTPSHEEKKRLKKQKGEVLVLMGGIGTGPGGEQILKVK